MMPNLREEAVWIYVFLTLQYGRTGSHSKGEGLFKDIADIVHTSNLTATAALDTTTHYI